MAGRLVQQSRNFATASSLIFFVVGVLLLLGWTTVFSRDVKRRIVVSQYSSFTLHAVSQPPVVPPEHSSPVTERPIAQPSVEERGVPQKPQVSTKRKKVKKQKKPVAKRQKEPSSQKQVKKTLQKAEKTPRVADKKSGISPSAQALPKTSQNQIVVAAEDVRNLVDRVKKYPKAAQRAGYGGLVKLRIELTRSGVITGYSLEESSGRIKLDEAALKAAKKIVGKKVTHAKLGGGLAVVVPVRFSLTKSR